MGLIEWLGRLSNNRYFKALVVLYAIIVVGYTFLALAEVGNDEYLRQKNECYSLYGEDNITFEVVEDGCYMAYINGTLVYAAGQVVDEEHPHYYGLHGVLQRCWDQHHTKL